MGDVLSWAGVVMRVPFNLFIAKLHVIPVVDGICHAATRRR